MTLRPIDDPNKVKDPESILDYFIDWTAWLAEGDSITTATWTIAGADAALVQASGKPSSIDVGRCTVWLDGGTDGELYTATCHIVTAQGREDDRTLTIRVRQR